MKRLSLMVLALALASAPLLAKDTSETAIRHSDQVFSAAWNSHDAKAMAATWMQDGDLINPSGRVAKGRAGIETLLGEEHATAFKHSTYTSGPITIHFLRPDVAVAECFTEITGVVNPDGSSAPSMNVYIMRIVQNKDGQWLTVSARPVIYPTAAVR
ncbi:MAG TPA: SgcJ/EcaC family oxidoreductase [Thermoanaerobaculia bacterium]